MAKTGSAEAVKFSYCKSYENGNPGNVLRSYYRNSGNHGVFGGSDTWQNWRTDSSFGSAVLANHLHN